MNTNKKNNLIDGEMISVQREREKSSLLEIVIRKMLDVDDNMLDRVKRRLVDNNDDQVHHSIVMNNPEEMILYSFSKK